MLLCCSVISVSLGLPGFNWCDRGAVHTHSGLNEISSGLYQSSAWLAAIFCGISRRIPHPRRVTTIHCSTMPQDEDMPQIEDESGKEAAAEAKGRAAALFAKGNKEGYEKGCAAYEEAEVRLCRKQGRSGRPARPKRLVAEAD